MDKDVLRRYIELGLSLPQIGKIVGRDPSTVGYWVKKHGLVANGRDRYAPRGGLTREQLEPLVNQQLTLREMSERLEVSVSTVCHWLKKFGLRVESRTRRQRRALEALRAGRKRFRATCIRHGPTDFIALPGGRSRCMRCNSEGVAARRRRLKQILIEEAGGRCRLCGYDGYPGALQFHHRDPGEKEFHVSRRGITRAIAEVREEAKKCVLLCANCHAEVKGGYARI